MSPVADACIAASPRPAAPVKPAPMRNEVATSLVAAGLALLAAGCKVQFEAETRVQPDGSAIRVSRYVAQQPSEKEELVERHRLLEGGGWRETKRRVFDRDTQQDVERRVSVYEVTRRTAPAEPLPSDYVRRGRSPGAMAQNAVAVSRHPAWWGARYEYRESFRDVASFARAAAVLEAGCTRAIEAFCVSVRERWTEPLDVLQLRHQLEAKYRPLLTQVTANFGISRAWHAAHADSQAALGAQFEDEAILAFLTSLGPTFAPGQDERWHDVAAAALADVWETLTRDDDQTSIERIEQAFGVHADLFQEFQFQLRARLPGRVIATNATQRIGHDLAWEFHAGDFFGRPYGGLRALARRRVGVAHGCRRGRGALGLGACAAPSARSPCGAHSMRTWLILIAGWAILRRASEWVVWCIGGPLW